MLHLNAYFTRSAIVKILSKFTGIEMRAECEKNFAFANRFTTVWHALHRPFRRFTEYGKSQSSKWLHVGGTSFMFYNCNDIITFITANLHLHIYLARYWEFTKIVVRIFIDNINRHDFSSWQPCESQPLCIGGECNYFFSSHKTTKYALKYGLIKIKNYIFEGKNIWRNERTKSASNIKISKFFDRFDIQSVIGGACW